MEDALPNPSRLARAKTRRNPSFLTGPSTSDQGSESTVRPTGSASSRSMVQHQPFGDRGEGLMDQDSFYEAHLEPDGQKDKYQFTVLGPFRSSTSSSALALALAASSFTGGTNSSTRRTVRFRGTESRRSKIPFRVAIRQCCGRLSNSLGRWLLLAEGTWLKFGRPLVVFTSLFELWSMGIWIGFLTERAMAPSLRQINIVDMACNCLYILDNAFAAMQERRRLLAAFDLERKAQSDRNKRGHSEAQLETTLHEASRDRGRASVRLGEGELGHPGRESGQSYTGLLPEGFLDPHATSSTGPAEGPELSLFQMLSGRQQLKVFCGLVLGLGMVPVQVLLYRYLTQTEYAPWQVALMLLFRAGRVVWAFRDCARLINQQELEVYVDIHMHGTSASSWNRALILGKQFIIVAFFGHWFGCVAYAMRITGHFHFREPDVGRDYFTKFADDGAIEYEVGEDFTSSYILAVYRGFNLNIEDLMPERPLDLIWEVVGSLLILLMKSYCVGSFFKYHQKRELQVARFSELMGATTQYLELYEVPPSLRKAVVGHFRFQQANHRKRKTLEVISQLPVEVQKKLTEHEVLPTVVDRNPLTFGNGLSRDYCLQIAVALATNFLQPGDILFLEHEVPRELLFLVAGAVACSRSLLSEGQRTEQLMRHVRADRKDDPTLLGGSALILACPHFHSARVRAGAEAVTLNMPRADFDELCLQFPDQHDQLVRNVAEAHLLDVRGRDLPHSDRAADHENESFMALQEDVRLTLQARQDSMNATFTYAASKGDVKLVKELLLKRVDANVDDYDKCSAMQVAASEGMTDVLEALLEAQGNANAKDRWGRTPMQEALKSGYVAAARILHKHGGRLELADPAGVLCTYASQGDTVAMQQLLDFGLDPNVGDYDARTALHVSASEGHLQEVMFLTSRKADVNARDRWSSTPMQDALRRGFPTVVSHLRSEGGRMDDLFVASQLCDAASTGDLLTLKMLAETGVDVDQGDYDARTALHLAAAEGQVLAVNFLLNMVLATHSPVDRWGATPLQSAMSAGHNLCVKLLLSAGAGMGPSADAQAWQAAQKVNADIGLKDGRITTFSESSAKLRRRLRSHLNLVQKGKARSDIFDTEEAQKFNKQVVNATFRQLHALKVEAEWIMSLLRKLEPASEATWQLLRLVRDGGLLLNEAKLWTELMDLKVRRLSKKRDKVRRLKDAQDMVFHRAFLNSTRFVPAMLNTLENTASRLLAKVRFLKEGRLGASTEGGLATTPMPRPRISVLVMDELLKELGWMSEDMTGFELIRNKRQDKGSDGMGFVARDDTLEDMMESLVARLEEQAKLLLPAEYTCLSLLSGALLLHDSGGSDNGDGPLWFGNHLPFDALRKWLEKRSRLILAGKPVDCENPPVLPYATRQKEAYGSLYPVDPKQKEGEPQPVPKLRPFRRGSSVVLASAEMVLSTEEAQALVVASELVLLAMTVLVLEGWDRGARLTEQEQVDAHMANRIRQGDVNRGFTGGTLTQEDFQEMGLLFREAARACRGAPEEAENLLRRNRKRARREEEAAAEAGGAGLSSPEASDDDGQRVTDQAPIRVAKFLALKDKMSLDELTILMDADDFLKPREEGKGTGAFGELSRERFTRNLLRCILNYDEIQNDVTESVMHKRIIDEVAMERELVANAQAKGQRQDGPVGPLPMSLSRRFNSSEDLNDLYDEIDRLHDDLTESSGGGSAAGLDGENPSSQHRHSSWSSKARDQVGSSNAQSPRFSWWKGPAVRGTRYVENQGTDGSKDAQASPRSNGQPAGSFASMFSSQTSEALSVPPHRLRVGNLIWSVWQFFGPEGQSLRKQRRIAKRFKELDDDGEGVGPAETAQLLAVAFRHTLGAEEELRWAYRVFELLNKADVGDLVTLPEVLEALPRIEEEIKQQQYNNRRGISFGSPDAPAVGAVTRFASGLVVPLESQFLQIWDWVRTVVVIYYMFEVPTRFSFLSRDHLRGWGHILIDIGNATSDVFMALNLLLTFFRAFHHPTHGVVTTFPEIRMHYLLGLFAVDAVASAPLDWWLPETNGEIGWLARPRAGARLLKLLHLHHLRQRERIGLEPTRRFSRTACYVAIGISILCHFLACIWWLLGTRYDAFDPEQVYNVTYADDVGRGTWLSTYVQRPGETTFGESSGQTPYWWQYLISFYWALGRITTQNSAGNLVAASWAELVWVCTLFFLNVAVNGYCDGILVDKVIAGDEQAIEAKAMRNIVNDYLLMAKLPADLLKEVRAGAEQFGKMVERSRMEDTIAALPHSFKQRVARRTVVPRLGGAEVFAACSESFLVELGAHCRILTVGKDQPLAHPGEPSSQLAILNTGRVAAMHVLGGQLADTSEPGEIIGEMPFIFNLKNCVLITAVEESRLTVLPRGDFVAACRMYPEDAATLRRTAMRLIQVLADGFEESGRTEDDRKSRNAFSRTKSGFSVASWMGGPGPGVPIGLNDLLRRLHVRELTLVAEKLQEEEAVAREGKICKFVREAADGDAGKVSSMLVKGEVLVDEGDYNHRTALHLAACNGHMEVVKVLVEKHHASVHVRDRFGATPAHDAVREKQVDILRYLLARGAHYQANADVAAQLCQAAFENDMATILLLLQEIKVNPNVSDYDQRTALHLGASEGHLGVVDLLLHVPDIDLSPLDRWGNTPLDDAMRHKHVQVRKLLYGKGAKMGPRNMGVVLCSLAAQNDIDGLRELAELGVALGQGDYDARTALHLAASENHLTAATYLLLEAKVDPNVPDRFLGTPLDDAIRHNHRTMEGLLRDQGGLRGTDPAMKAVVARFAEDRKAQEAELFAAKLEKEVQNSEVSTIMSRLKRLREHPHLEEDVHSFTTHAANFRDLLLRLLSWSVRAHHEQPPEQVAGGEDEESRTLLTKMYRERLLEWTCAEIDANSSRLVGVLEQEVLPWLNGLSKAEARLARVLAPDLKPAVMRIVEQLQGGSRLTKIVNRLWSDRGPGGGAYQCLPVGLLAIRASSSTAALAHRARVEAEALLWATGASAGQRPGIEATAVQEGASAYFHQTL